jgi:hypothetical protein
MLTIGLLSFSRTLMAAWRHCCVLYTADFLPCFCRVTSSIGISRYHQLAVGPCTYRAGLALDPVYTSELCQHVTNCIVETSIWKEHYSEPAYSCIKQVAVVLRICSDRRFNKRAPSTFWITIGMADVICPLLMSCIYETFLCM